MFDLFNDLDTYRGIPPYASEHFGVYQPILGWRSHLTAQWVRRGAKVVDPRLRRIVDGRITPSPTVAVEADPRAVPRPAAGARARPQPLAGSCAAHSRQRAGRRPARPGAGLCRRARRAPAAGRRVGERHRHQHAGDADNGPLKVVQDRHKQRIFARIQAEAGAGGVTPPMVEAARAELLSLMRYQSQIAALLVFHAEAQEGFDPATLEQLYVVVTAPRLDEVLAATDPLASIDPNDLQRGAVTGRVRAPVPPVFLRPRHLPRRAGRARLAGSGHHDRTDRGQHPEDACWSAPRR